MNILPNQTNGALAEYLRTTVLSTPGLIWQNIQEPLTQGTKFHRVQRVDKLLFLDARGGCF